MSHPTEVAALGEEGEWLAQETGPPIWRAGTLELVYLRYAWALLAEAGAAPAAEYGRQAGLTVLRTEGVDAGRGARPGRDH